MDQIAMTQEEFLLLDEFCSTRFGLTFPQHKKEILESRLRPRLQALKLRHFMDYYLTLQYNADGSEEIRRFIEAITNNETYFFRELYQINALFEEGISQVTQAPVLPDTLRILCAGCSSGEEPYTINICGKESLPSFSSLKLEIDAFDLDPTRLATARQAEFSPSSVRALTPEQIIRYFTVTAPERYQLRPMYREGIRFSEGNLVDLSTFKRPVLYDVIFCRNVLIYFSEPALHQVIDHFARCLRPGGLLFLGHSESIFGVSKFFESMRLGPCVIYKRTLLT
jgi:chemotaxis protein methyltransferase CheR